MYEDGWLMKHWLCSVHQKLDSWLFPNCADINVTSVLKFIFLCNYRYDLFRQSLNRQKYTCRGQFIWKSFKCDLEFKILLTRKSNKIIARFQSFFSVTTGLMPFIMVSLETLFFHKETSDLKIIDLILSNRTSFSRKCQRTPNFFILFTSSNSLFSVTIDLNPWSAVST